MDAILRDAVVERVTPAPRSEPSHSTGAGLTPAVLFVGDDALAVRAVERALALHCTVTTIRSGADAMHLLETGQQYVVLMADLASPGMSGIALLSALRHIAPDTARILFTDDAHLKDAVGAINDGAVFHLLLKPASEAAVVDAVQAGIRQHHHLVSERQLLRETLQGAVEALSEVLAIAQPAAYGRAIRLKRHVSDLAGALSIEPRWEVEVAALLSQLGCVTLSPELVDRWYHHRSLTPDEQDIIDRLPHTSTDLVAHIPRLETVREIIHRQYDPPSAPGLPAGARLLAIARDFDVLIGAGERAEQALAHMERDAVRYDKRMLDAFRSLRSDKAPAADIRDMRLCDVRPGMIFATDVHSPRGVLLIARGQRVTPSLRERIAQVWSAAVACEINVRIIVP